jgi:hypothetical protein
MHDRTVHVGTLSALSAAAHRTLAPGHRPLRGAPPPAPLRPTALWRPTRRRSAPEDLPLW